jgi:hypothetical protein
VQSLCVAPEEQWLSSDSDDGGDDDGDHLIGHNLEKEEEGGEEKEMEEEEEEEEEEGDSFDVSRPILASVSLQTGSDLYLRGARAESGPSPMTRPRPHPHGLRRTDLVLCRALVGDLRRLLPWGQTLDRFCVGGVDFLRD